ncbi:hypothetical protein CGGC5_v009612 [Colletotrichum fructicola Nara gc5]|uniref:Uncharacterized protein n=1 Tax=Colletotrichum fructicola (strain Nara gc5) TaxID=1213859 RepID=A0A7J6J0E4_COLFN|nr:hypothetical protein CGGC5_v009612 [Colletotrichum fructicola Nara gc5]
MQMHEGPRTMYLWPLTQISSRHPSQQMSRHLEKTNSRLTQRSPPSKHLRCPLLRERRRDYGLPVVLWSPTLREPSTWRQQVDITTHDMVTCCATCLQDHPTAALLANRLSS